MQPPTTLIALTGKRLDGSPSRQFMSQPVWNSKVRIFQANATHPDYLPRLRHVMKGATTFREMIDAFFADGHDGVHTLAPVRTWEEYAFYTHPNDEVIQRAWAREHGLPGNIPLDDILLAQIEEHRSDVFYCMSTQYTDSKLARRMPSCVKAKIGFNASPSTDQDMSAYLMVCNFPFLLEKYRSMGLRTAFFSPSHDPTLDPLSPNEDRDIDVLFAGTYSRWHKRRSQTLEAVAALHSQYRIVFALQQSRLSRIADTPLGWVGPLKKYSRPIDVRAVAQGPAFGLQYYKLLTRAKIVLNGAGDIGGNDRGNMRCWEALGARSLMVTDAGNYPEGMVDGETMRTYQSPAEAVAVIKEMLASHDERQRIANAGNTRVRERYSKARQWADFQKLVADNF